MPDKLAYNYAVIRVVPHVEREEFINVGIILFCKTQKFLDTKIHIDKTRLASLAPSLNINKVESQLALIPKICAGGPDAGPIGSESQSERFHWLTSSSSTIIQTSAVHTGICEKPAEELEELFEQLVLV